MSKTKSFTPTIDVWDCIHTSTINFSDDEIQEMYKEVKCTERTHNSDQLRVALIEATLKYRGDVYCQTIPTSRQINTEAKKIADLCGKLVSACKVDGQWRHGIGAGGLYNEAALENIPWQGVDQAFEAVVQLQKWAINLAKRVDGTPQSKGGASNVALDTFLLALGDAYRNAFGKNPAFSRPPLGGNASGPFVRFMQCVLPKAKIDLKSDALEKAYKRAMQADKVRLQDVFSNVDKYGVSPEQATTALHRHDLQYPAIDK